MECRSLSLKTLIGLCIMILAVCQLSGCGGSNTSTGTLMVAITDKPSDDYEQVVVAVREVRVVPAGLENAADGDSRLPVVARFATPKQIDVMQLKFAQEVLGQVILAAGKYTQIRFILAENPNGQGQDPVNYLTLKTSTTNKIALKSPSGQKTGLKLIGHLEVKAGAINAVTIDFDPNTAIVAEGNGGYSIKPTGIRLVQTTTQMATFGTIAGNVGSTFKDWSSATVSIKRRGAINDSEPIAVGRIFSSYTSGRWQAPFTAFVPATTQTVSYKTFIVANGFRIYSSPALSVTERQFTDLQDITLVPAD